MSDAESLLDAFLKPGQPSALAREMAGRLEPLLAAARAEHPLLVVDELAFSRFVATRLCPDTPVEDLAALHLTDLYLAFACGNGNPRAQETFERILLGGWLERALSRIITTPAALDEVRQTLRVRFLVGDDGPGKILDYAGRGPLTTWVRVSAVRTALNLTMRDEGKLAEPFAEPLMGCDDPETVYLKVRYQGEFADAFREALVTLSPQQRHLLRLHYLDGLTLAQIGQLAGTHESTASRRLLAARDQLLGATRRLLSEKLAVAQPEVDTLMGKLLSGADITLSMLLRSAERQDGDVGE